MIAIGLMVTMRCPAVCDHCCYFCSPAGNELYGDLVMPIEMARSYIKQVASLPVEIAILGFSGGEPFLLGENLVTLVQYATDQGLKRIGSTTNGYWATSRQAALARLLPLRQAGLRQLDVSLDDFHQAYIPLENIKNLLWAARETDIRVGLRTVTTRKTKKLEDYRTMLGELGETPPVSRAEEWRCSPAGRALIRVPAEDLFWEEKIPIGPCPAPQIIIFPNGDTFFCCSTSQMNNPLLKLGNASVTPLATLWNRFTRDELYRILIFEGPAAFLPRIQSSGLEAQLLTHYVNICHVCQHILSHPALLAVVKEEIHERETRRILAIADRLQIDKANSQSGER